MAYKPSTKFYKFSGFPFRQSVLTFPEFEQAVQLCGKFIDDVQSLTGFGAVLDKLISSATVPELMKLIIKPHETTIVHRVYYAIMRIIKKVDPVNPIALMDIDEVAEVLRDFFTINTSSLSSWMLIANQSGLLPGTKDRAIPSAPTK